ncbi:EF-hand domain-containing protein [Microtetraspora sp. NBRC 16547]|uniref:EF-hand domain-containing protein n=1 Tax=Microtetraspora sp. NBRC 16547 TaxID=3030993 RepID=UPI002556AC33|nr:EF-hand domain-containing protein [Microtetraspora sp. NBRC 16547]
MATDEIFSRLDLDGDGHLARDEFRTHWTEFWAGDDPNAPGLRIPRPSPTVTFVAAISSPLSGFRVAQRFVQCIPNMRLVRFLSWFTFATRERSRSFHLLWSL